MSTEVISYLDNVAQAYSAIKKAPAGVVVAAAVNDFIKHLRIESGLRSLAENAGRADDVTTSRSSGIGSRPYCSWFFYRGICIYQIGETAEESYD